MNSQGWYTTHGETTYFYQSAFDVPVVMARLCDCMQMLKAEQCLGTNGKTQHSEEAQELEFYEKCKKMEDKVNGNQFKAVKIIDSGNVNDDKSERIIDANCSESTCIIDKYFKPM